jgi:hypothetical protein
MRITERLLGVGGSNVLSSRSVSSWNKGDMAAVRLGAMKCLLSTPKLPFSDVEPTGGLVPALDGGGP